MIKYLSILILKAHIHTCAWNYAGGKNQDIGNTHGAPGVGHWCAAPNKYKGVIILSIVHCGIFPHGTRG
jgi:hypothetical protein